MASKPKPEYRPTDTRQPYVKPIGPFIPQIKFDESAITEYMNAILESDYTRVYKILSEHRLPYDVCDKNGNSVLHIILNKEPSKFSEQQKISMMGKVDNIETLSLKPNVHGVTPLHIASMYQYANIIRKLCPTVINLNIKDVNGLTPLHYAVVGYTYPCQRKRTRDIERDMEVIPPRFNTVSKERRTKIVPPEPSHELIVFDSNNLQGIEQVCIRTNIGTIQTLIECGASVHEVDNHGLSPIFYALQNNNISILQELMKQPSMSLLTPVSVSGSPYQYFKNRFISFLDTFADDRKTHSIISDFAEPHVSDLLELSNKEDTYYQTLYQLIPVQILTIFDDQIRLSLDRKVIERANIIANGNVNYVEFWLDPAFKNFAKSENSVCDYSYEPYLNEIKKLSAYIGKWKMLHQTEMSSGIKHLVVELLTTSCRGMISDPHNKLSIQLIRDMEYTCDKMEQDINNYRYIPENLDENYMMSRIVKIIAHTLLTTIGYKIYIELIIKRAEEELKNLPAGSPTVTLKDKINELNQQQYIYTTDWGKSMFTHIVKWTLKIDTTDKQFNSINDILVHYMTTHPSSFVLDSTLNTSENIVKKYESLITMAIDDCKKLIDSYINYFEGWIQYTRMMVYILKNYK